MDQQILDYFEGFEENTRIVPLKYFFFESEAHLYAARLKEAGIPCFISNANIMTVLPLGGGGGIGLHIREADLPEASRIAARLDYQKNHDTPELFHGEPVKWHAGVETATRDADTPSENQLHGLWVG